MLGAGRNQPRANFFLCEQSLIFQGFQGTTGKTGLPKISTKQFLSERANQSSFGRTLETEYRTAGPVLSRQPRGTGPDVDVNGGDGRGMPGERSGRMYLKEYEVPIPYDRGKIVIRNEQYVLLETERKYSGETKNTRVKRIMIGKVVPLFGGMMYPNEHYFELIPNDVPPEIRDPFLARCERKHEIAELKKDPEKMMQTVVKGIRFLQNTGRKIKMENKEEQKEEQFWFITNAHDLENVMKVFGDLYNLIRALVHSIFRIRSRRRGGDKNPGRGDLRPP